MTDFELIAMAAKAAGMRIEWIGDVAFDCTKLKAGKPAFKGDMWNPLTDDGAALRLAASLSIDIEWKTLLDGKSVAAFQRSPEGGYNTFTEDPTDYRRAIVRAAAEIGRR